MAAKKPISQKGRAAPINMDDIFGNALGIDAEVAKAIEASGQVYRFINVKRLQDMGGYHPQGWRPWKPSPEQRAKMEGQSLLFGSDPDGFVRRGDCVLAVRSKELNEKHKSYLRQEVARTENVTKTAAQQMREFVRSNGLDMRVQEGAEVYEDFGDDEKDE
jgi:hypothetical protein